MDTRTLTDAKFDFVAAPPLRKSYIVASSDRGSSTFFCLALWQSGRLGAPWEYVNANFEGLSGSLAMPVPGSVASAMMTRLHALDPAEYLTKLLQCRTSANGVFGIKARFDDFQGALNEIPGLLKTLAPVTFVFFDHRDKLRQAVSAIRFATARRMAAERTQPQYDRDMISRFLGRLERQRLAWQRWFETNNTEPLVFYHEDINADVQQGVRTLAGALNVEDDAADNIDLPYLQPATDPLAEAWAERFNSEIERGVDIRQSQTHGRTDLVTIMDFEPESGRGEQIPVSGKVRAEIERHESQQVASTGIARQPPAAAAPTVGWWEGTEDRPAAGKVDPAMRGELARYDPIIGSNRALLRGAKILELMCGGGRYSLALLDAGAASVFGIDPRPGRIAAAEQTFARRGIPRDSYRFVMKDMISALHELQPGSFDVIVARGALGSRDIREFFVLLRQLKPKHIILDNPIALGNGAFVRFARRATVPDIALGGGASARAVRAIPSHELIVLLCGYFGFQWHLVEEPNPAAMANGQATRRTYVLDWIAQ